MEHPESKTTSAAARERRITRTSYVGIAAPLPQPAMNGFFRLAVCVPELRVGDPSFNAARIADLYREADAAGAALALFPELAVAGATCGDFFGTRALLDASDAALRALVRATEGRRAALVVGAPVRDGARLMDAAAVIAGGRILGFAVKSVLSPDELRRFRPAREFGGAIRFGGADVPAGTDLLFRAGEGDSAFRFCVEIGADALAPVPPADALAVAGAHAILGLAAEPELVASAETRRARLAARSARLAGVCALAGAGCGESTSEGAFAGPALVAFDGAVLAEGPRFARGASMALADVNPRWCEALRAARPGFAEAAAGAAVRAVELPPLPESPDLKHAAVAARPFVPADPATLAARCRDILDIQATALAGRAARTGAKRLVLGVSGGLDSTVAALACARAADRLGKTRRFLLAVTMPGFGTTKRTKGNALRLAEALGAETREIPIGPAVKRHFADIGHDPEDRDATYENAQARERTQILMDLANQEGGLVVGTGDLSEIALGWCTYNGDQMSMYGVNAGVPKTLLRSIAATEAEAAPEAVAAVLRDVLATPVSPELLPGGAETQKTEGVLGRYELHDFFLWHLFKYGETPENLRSLALRAFGKETTAKEVDAALALFLRRFATQQFKRAASPDAPRIGSVDLSPRGAWRAPSDAGPAVFGL